MDMENPSFLGFPHEFSTFLPKFKNLPGRLGAARGAQRGRGLRRHGLQWHTTPCARRRGSAAGLSSARHPRGTRRRRCLVILGRGLSGGNSVGKTWQSSKLKEAENKWFVQGGDCGVESGLVYGGLLLW